MKRQIYLAIAFAGILALQSCNEKKDTSSNDATENVGQNNDSIAKNENLGSPTEVKADPGIYQIKPLKYGYDEINEYIDGVTMKTHFSKHYLGYINNLNKALKETNNKEANIVKLLKDEEAIKNNAIRNNGGGYYNHMLYFDIISPSPEPLNESGALIKKINETFGSLDNLKTQLKESASKQFGSGWAWLVVQPDGALAVTSTPNQDNPLMPVAEVQGTPILGIDVWEHAYYLKYKNLRADYIDAFFNVLDWKEVENNYNKAVK